ncbi:hypothetical protein UMC2_34291 [[Clostridium] sordellii]|uniref:hypothetical protein n=1 Tax=Paraclostridium sordellii TaxID=1505 RepID=UPI00054373D1|nr:hypothetical protein [Paeniclostridium sordellii]CEK36559.1 hypothetical protein UMC2_34291 [[Clostridium] sordellii] [Paeniclostridium sordellii]
MNILIIVKNDKNISKNIIIIRKFTGKSMTEIRSNIIDGKPIFIGEVFEDEEKIKLVKDLLLEINGNGSKFVIMKKENNEIEEISLKNLLNRIKRFREISKENQELDDLMYY